MNHQTFQLPEVLTFHNTLTVYDKLSNLIKRAPAGTVLQINFEDVAKIDSAGAALISRIEKLIHDKKGALEIINCSENIKHTLEILTAGPIEITDSKKTAGFFESLGNAFYNAYSGFIEVVFLLANVSYYSIVAFFKPKLRRRGEVVHQSILIGVNALPIIALIAFLIGFILALQSAAQLRQFGANIYVADLVAIAMVSEMGPLITAIMVAGRSGSAIAAEIATMTVTEEIDALKVMGIDPIPYLVVPKLFSILITLPMLTIFANVIGILGGMIIGITYLDIDIIPFYNEVISVLRYKELITSMAKSISFAVIIALTGTYFGFKVKGGAEGVGRATTAAVVFSIFLVIVADSILGLFFYFGEPAF